jgi:3-hydroxyisobutyrate dehydrogenase-like beta-hydroxyacid dehydrogenase
MSTIAFIGLGIMGSPMAVHLQNAGNTVVGYNPSPEKAQPLVDAGGSAAGSIAEAVKDADVVAVMVPDSPDVQDVLLGEEGVFAGAKEGTLVIDFSSIRPDVTVELAKTAKDKGFRLLDAPVSGGEAGAKNAALSIMVGGDAADFDAAIARYTDRTAHVQVADAPGRGEPGTGDLDLDRYLGKLSDHGYAGWVGLEYKPTTATTPESLGWLPRERRAAG